MRTTCARTGEAVELDEELVQRLVVLTVEARARAAHADGVELVDEDDRGRVLARLLEELADAGGAEAGEHLDERGGALRVEGRARGVRDRLREQRLAGARAGRRGGCPSGRARRAGRTARVAGGSRRPPAARRRPPRRRRCPSQVTDDFESGSTSVGLTRGMSPTRLHISHTSRPMKISGSHV